MITKYGYRLPLSTLNGKIDQQKKELTVKPLSTSDYDSGPEFPVYRINSTMIYMPKFYGIDKFGKVPSNEYEGKDININFNGNLRSDQDIFINEIYSKLSDNDGCIGCAGTGQGKTVMALKLISMLKKKTLILVHKEFLMDQWKERINQFMPNTNIGIIQRDKIEVEGKDIVIGMLQSISMKQYPKDLFDDFGFLIVDEAHHICSRTFSRVLFKTACKKMLGLSATPLRKDGLTMVLNWFLGPIIYKDNIMAIIDNPHVNVIKALYEKELEIKYNKKGLLNLPDLINQITSDQMRNLQIINKIKELHLLGRKIICLSDRRSQCIYINSLLLRDKDFKGTTGLYIGSMKKEKLEESNKADVILATYQIASEGYDNPELDTLIFMSPKSDIEQSCGRILRKKNKNPPLIIDIVDVEHRSNQYRTRRQFYKKKGYTCDNLKSTKKSKEKDTSDNDNDENDDNKEIEKNKKDIFNYYNE